MLDNSTGAGAPAPAPASASAAAGAAVGAGAFGGVVACARVCVDASRVCAVAVVVVVVCVDGSMRPSGPQGECGVGTSTPAASAAARDKGARGGVCGTTNDGSSDAGGVVGIAFDAAVVVAHGGVDGGAFSAMLAVRGDGNDDVCVCQWR